MNIRQAAVVAIAMAIPAIAGAYPTVYFEPEVLFLEVGEPCSISIRVDDGTDTLTCFLVEFTFEPEVLEITAAREGSLFSESGHATMFDWDVVAPGRHQCNDVTLGFEAYVICPGELVELELEGAAEGTTVISIETVDLRDLRRDPILPVAVGSCSVTVVSGTGSDGGKEDAPLSLWCAPNPFRSELAIEVRTGRDEVVDFRVLNAAGNVVARPVGRAAGPGIAAAVWEGKGSEGRPLPSGVYFVEACCGSEVSRARVTLLR